MKLFNNTKTFIFRDDSEIMPMFYILSITDETKSNTVQTLISHCATISNLRNMLNTQNIEFKLMRIDEVTDIPSLVYQI